MIRADDDIYSVSGSMALCGSYHYRMPRRGIRALCLYVLLYMLIGFGIYLCTRLAKWDLNAPGQCYDPRLVASPASMHPQADIGYISVTMVYSGVGLSYPMVMFRYKWL